MSLQREIILLGEAASAVGQCTALLGEERTNRILREIDHVAEEKLKEFHEIVGSSEPCR